MSDPYRDSFGVGTIGGGLEGGDLEEVNTQLSKTEEVLISIANQLSGMSNQFSGMANSLEKSFSPVTKEMTKTKFIKSSKKLNSMFKVITSIKGSLLQIVSKSLTTLINKFSGPFKTAMDLGTGLLEIMVSEALQPMYDAMSPLYDTLLDLIPEFQAIGTELGDVLTPIIEDYLVPAFGTLATAFTDTIGNIIGSDSFESALTAIGTVLNDTIVPIIEEDLLPAFEDITIAILDVVADLVSSDGFKDALELIGTTIGEVVTTIADALSIITTDFNFLGKDMSALDIIMGGLNAALGLVLDPIGTFRGWMYDLGVLFGTITEEEGPYLGTYGGVYGKYGGYYVGAGGEPPSLQEGGIVSEGIYKLGEHGTKEVVTPLDTWEKSISQQNALLGIIHDELLTQSFYNRELVKMKEWKRAFG